MIALNKIWETASGYEAVIRESSRGQYVAFTRKSSQVAWIEIGHHYGNRHSAYDACEDVGEKVQ